MSAPDIWSTDVVLVDGATARVRPAHASDAAAIEQFFAERSDETIYSRFFSYRRPSPADIERFLDVDYITRFPFVMEHNGRIIAYAGYDLVPDRQSAEVAFIVDEADHGRGIGTILFEHLAAVAKSNGITCLHAETLGPNRAMLRVFTHAGYPVQRSLDGGIWDIEIDLDDPAGTAAIERGRREQLADARSVARILAPRSVAVVGASPTAGTLGRHVLRNVIDGGFTGTIHPVHPTAATVLGLSAAPRVGAIADQVDLAVVIVPAAEVLDVVRECGEAGVAALVVISAGFADAGLDGATLQAEVLAVSRSFGMRLVGPNCMGILNTAPDVRLDASVGAVHPHAGNVGLASQSGALGIAIMRTAAEFGLGISSFVSMGNKADVSGNDLLQFWETDPRTDVVLLYLESFGNPRKFARIARRIAPHKAIVAVKAGRVARNADGAHGDAIVDALFGHTGVIRVETVSAMFDVARILSTQPVPTGGRVGILSNSAGPATLANDACLAAGLEVPELRSDRQATLAAALRWARRPPTR